MAPTLVREPFHRDGWVFEEKVDGWRILAYKAGDSVRLVSRNGATTPADSVSLPPPSRSCRRVHSSWTAKSRSTTGSSGRASSGCGSPTLEAVASPPVFMIFDLLYHDRRDLPDRPLRDRRVRLGDVVAGSELVFPVPRLAPDGLEAWAQVVERGYEGYVAQDERSPYEGGPTRRWLKVKQVGWTVSEDHWKRVLLGPGTPPTQASRA